MGSVTRFRGANDDFGPNRKRSNHPPLIVGSSSLLAAAVAASPDVSLNYDLSRSPRWSVCASVRVCVPAEDDARGALCSGLGCVFDMRIKLRERESWRFFDSAPPGEAKS